MLEWSQVRGEFYRDASLRDIDVLGTGIEHWQLALNALRSSPFPIAYSRAGVPCALPSRAADVFGEPGRTDRLLTVDLHGPTANCHSFTETEIEFDVDPREVSSQRELDSVLRFMCLLANATEREATLTPENLKDTAIFRVRPHDDRVEYVPPCG